MSGTKVKNNEYAAIEIRIKNRIRLILGSHKDQDQIEICTIASKQIVLYSVPLAIQNVRLNVISFCSNKNDDFIPKIQHQKQTILLNGQCWSLTKHFD